MNLGAILMKYPQTADCDHEISTMLQHGEQYVPHAPPLARFSGLLYLCLFRPNRFPKPVRSQVSGRRYVFAGRDAGGPYWGALALDHRHPCRCI